MDRVVRPCESDGAGGPPVLRPCQIVGLYVPGHRQAADESGANQVGFVISPTQIIYFENRRRRVMAPTSSEAQIRFVSEPRVMPHVGRTLAFFEKAQGFRLFAAGLKALRLGNCRFFDAPIMPCLTNESDPRTFEKRWESVERLLQFGDAVFTLQKSSRISRAVARLDGGCWSHVAAYLGDGVIQEALTGVGVVRRALSVYRDPSVRVGAYRLCENIDKDGRLNMEHYLDSVLGQEYNYLGAIKCGLLTLFDIPREFPTPNGLLYRGAFYLLDWV